MHITGARDGPPVKVGVAITDLTTGLYTSNAVMAALISQMRTGKGQHVDIALSDCQVASLTNIASSVLVSGQPDTGRWGTAHRKLCFHGQVRLLSDLDKFTDLSAASIVPYRGYKTSDGDLLLGGGNDRLFGIICEKLGHPEWATDERMRTNPDRVENRDLVDSSIQNTLEAKTTQEWLDIFEGGGVPYAAINDIKETLNHKHGGFLDTTCHYR